MRLHDTEMPADVETARTLLREQCPDWSELPLSEAGSGTDNTMYRLGEELLVRLPRTPNTAEAITKERTWLPRLSPHLPLAVPEPVHDGRPSRDFPLVWSVYRWIDGAEVSDVSVTDWERFAVDIGEFVRALHGTELMGARPEGGLRWYRGGSLADPAGWIGECFEEARGIAGLDLDVDRLEKVWREALALPDPTVSKVWLHGDLKPSNLLVSGGGLKAVIDFGCLSIGFPDAEHAAVWDLPEPARSAYWTAMELDELTWLRARGWAIGVAISGVPYYWESNPAFVDECLKRLRAVLDHG